MNATELKTLLDEIAHARFTLDRFAFEHPDRMTIRRPATADEIGRWEAVLKNRSLRPVPSHRLFLSVANGVELFDDPLSLFGVKELMQDPNPFYADDFPSLYRYQIGGGNTSAFLAFDTSATPPDHELPLVQIAENGGETRYDNLPIYLAEYRAALAGMIQLEEDNRKNLRP